MDEQDTRLERLYSVSVEKTILGSLLLDNSNFDTITEELTPDDFFVPLNQQLYKEIFQAIEKESFVDTVTLVSKMGRTGEAEKELQLYVLGLLDSAPSSYNIRSYIKILKEKRILRFLTDELKDINEKIFTEKVEIDPFLDEIEARILRVGDQFKSRQSSYATMKTILMPFMAKVDKLMSEKKGVTGVPTGFVRLDKMLTGMQPSDLLILAARPSMGKTALAINIAVNAAMNSDCPVGIFSLEMSRDQIVARMLSSLGRIDAQNLRLGQFKDDEYQKLIHTADRLSKAGIYIDDTPAISIHTLLARARRLKKERDIQLIVVDYLQLMKGEAGMENRVQEITNISQGLKRIAKEINIPVLALSQLSRKVEERPDKRPILSDLRESGSIEQDADVVMFIHREEYYKKDDVNLQGIGEVIIAKHRNGPTGSVKLQFTHKFTRFDNLEDREFNL
ncbi:MAG: primary replicative DNA helicase [Magnetococcales bacterium]|nr:primary replicative DNA helicase [Magnetococcales bacterium]HIJ83256.1 replicative DNA helicase [Magnetococcales bacterium]